MANAASYILLVGFILLALMIWENNQYSEYNAQMAKNTRIAQGLEKQERQVTNSDKLYQQALMALDVSYCSQTNIKDLCEKEISAIKNNDITYCDSLADNEFNQIRCYERFAEMKNDTSVCERLQSGYVNECQQLQDIIKVQDLTKPYYQ